VFPRGALQKKEKSGRCHALLVKIMHGLVNIIIGKNLFRRSLHGSSKNVHQYCDGSSDPGCEVDIKIAGNVNFIHPKFVISFDLSPCV